VAEIAVGPRVAISALFALDGAALGGWLAHLPDVQRSLELSKGQLGSILLFSSVGAISAMFLSGTLIHRFGSRRVSVAAAVLVLAIVPFLLRAPTPAWLAFTLVLMGATNGTVDIAMNDHAVAIQARMDRPILSSVHGWWCVGGFLGGAGTALANALNVAPKDHLVFASIVLLAVLLVGAPGLLRDVEGDEEGARFALPRGTLLGLGLLSLLAMFAEGALLDWSALYFRDELRTTSTVAALGFGVGSAAMAAGRLLGDLVVARLGRAGTLRLSGLLTGGGLLLGVSFASPPGAFLGFALAGLGLANAVPVLFAAAAEVPGVSSSAGIAAVASLGYAAFLGGPPVVGHVAQATSLRVGLALVGAFALLIALFGPRAVGHQASER